MCDKNATIHKFELAGLGKAPFRFIGFQSGGWTHCDYCYETIKNEFLIKSSDGKTFRVGCNCVNKTGDAGLIKQYKASPEYKEAKRKAAQQKDEKVKVQMAEIINRHENELKGKPHPNKYMAESKGLTFFDYANWVLNYSGATGRNQAFKRLKYLFPN